MIPRQIGRFEIREQIGKGGMGEVLLGYDLILSRLVALKLIRQERRFDTEAKARFLREARTLSKLDHPGICRIYDYIENPNADLLVLEYIEGVTFKQVKASSIDFPTKLDYLIQVADILAAAHGAQIVHRDLKPDNLMLQNDGRIKILDFGLACHELESEPRTDKPAKPAVSNISNGSSHDLGSGSHTTAGSLVGTLDYMSPEQARGEVADSASDMYAFGILAQELLSAQRAYSPSTSLPTKILKVGRADTRAIHETAPHLNVQLRRLIEELTDVAPEKRPNAAQCATRFRDFVQKPQRMRRRYLWTVAVTLLILCVALFAALFHRSPAVLSMEDEQPRVAILPFQCDLSEEEFAWVPLGMPEIVRQNLQRQVSVDTISIADIKKTTAGQQNGKMATNDLNRITELLGTDLLVTGRISRKDPGFLIHASFYKKTKLLGEELLRGNDLVAMSEMLSTRLAHRFQVDTKEKARPGILSHDKFVNSVYAVGLHIFLTEGPKPAQPYFQICLQRDPSFLWARHYAAKIAYRLGDYQNARTLNQETLEGARKAEDTELVGQSLWQLGKIANANGDYNRADILFLEALDLFRKENNARGLGRGYYYMGHSNYSRGNMDQAAKFFKNAWQLQKEGGNMIDLARTANFMGLVAMANGFYEEAETHFLEARVLFSNIGETNFETLTLGNLGLTSMEKGDLVKAQEYLSQALEITQAAGDRRNELIIRLNLGKVWLTRGQLNQAESEYEALLGLTKELGDQETQALAYASLAEVALERKEAEKALSFIDQAQALDSYVKDHFQTWIVRGQSLVALGRHGEAVQALRRAKTQAGQAWKTEWETLLKEADKHAATKSRVSERS